MELMFLKLGFMFGFGVVFICVVLCMIDVFECVLIVVYVISRV